MTEHKINISGVAWPEGDRWVIQGIEYDIVAHATDVTGIPEAFANAVMENACITLHLGRKPLEGIAKAPDRFRRMYDAAQTSVSMVNPPNIDAGLPPPDINIRVTAHAY